MGNEVSAANARLMKGGQIKATGPLSVRVDLPSVELYKENGAKESVQGPCCFAVSKVSKFWEVKAEMTFGVRQETLPHYGVLLENQFQLQNATNKKEIATFSFLLVHALQQSDDPRRVKLDLFFAKDRQAALMRLSSLVGKKPADVRIKPSNSEGWAAVGRAPELCSALDTILQKEFSALVQATRAGPELNQEMVRGLALQQYNNASNCVLAAQHLIAVLLGKDPAVYVESYISMNRGKLLKLARTNLDQIDDGVPCSDGFFWHTLREEQRAGYCYRLQQHKGEEMGAVISLSTQIVRTIAPWSIHNKAFRLIRREEAAAPGQWSWREIGRHNDLMPLTKMLNSLLVS